MRAGKVRKLKAAGWAVGDATDFLQLSSEEQSMVELRTRLADGLKVRRMRRKLTQQDLARVVGSSQSPVAKMEAGDPTVSIDLLMRSLLAMGATNNEIARIIAAPKDAAFSDRSRFVTG